MMNVPLYIGDKKAKDKIVSAELSRFTEGNRCDRVKDLILKGLLYEGRAGIPEHLLEDKYILRETVAKPKGRSVPQLVTTREEPKDIPEFVRVTGQKPSFDGELKKKHINDDDLESKI